MNGNYLSKEKIQELKLQLQDLKTTKRIEIAERLKKAKEFGDLSENFEYSQAKEDQEKLEMEIYRLEDLVKNAQIITKPHNKSVVSVGLSVTLKSKEKGKITFDIVGSQEADPVNNKISNASPLGKELIGKKVGDHVSIKTPKGSVLEYDILDID
jgi:transcription elongation factor GreA